MASSDDKRFERELEKDALAEEKVLGTEPLERVGTEAELETARLEKDAQALTEQVTRASSIDSSDDGVDKPANTLSKAPSKTWLERLNPLRYQKARPVPQERIISREYGVGFWSLLTFQWITPLMTTGYLRVLEPNDIWLVNPERSSEILVARLQASFKRRIRRGDKYPLLWALHETFHREFWIGGFCSLSSSIFQVIAPFTVRFLIAFADKAYYAEKAGRPPPEIGHGIGLVIGISVMQLCQSLGTNHFIYRGMTVGGQIRAVLINVIFEKAMKLSGRAKAGGRRSDDDPEAMGEELSQAMSSKSTKDNFIKKMLKKKLQPKGGPKVTPDKAQGISGDGTGWSNGKIVNLMSVDTYRVDQASGMFHLMWTSPVAILITLAVLLVNLSYSALAGFGLLIVSMPILTKTITTLFKRRRKINKVTDQRVSLTQEILAAVRFVKFFGWEKSFLERLGEIRRREIHAIQILLAIRNAITAVSMSMPVFASMLAFITYSLSNHVLDPAPIFSSLALFNSLRLPLNLLPLIIGQVIDAWASLGRIQEFLLAEEQKEAVEWNDKMESAVEMQHASFTWERTATHDPDKPATFKTKKELKAEKEAKKSDKKTAKHAKDEEVTPPGTAIDDESSETMEKEPFKIHDMDFSIGRNELVAVIGSVGSGKSSLLAALAGDMRKTSGKVLIGASRAFCPQYAWIQNATLKENILFGKPYNDDLYNRVLDACALRPDLDMLPGGDQTEIGEKGITVSGGQKQRLNIARAVYFNADLVLMDDPLSAVDAHVGRHIMDNAICGPLLKDKARVLCTHQLWVLNRCDRIIWMEDGGIKIIDSYDNLMRDNAEFQKLMTMTSQEGMEERKKEDEDDEITADKKDAKKAKTSKRGGALMQQEERAVKSVSWGVYKAYIQASGTIYPGVINGILILFALIMSQCTNIATSLWLSYWTSNKFGLSEGQYIGVYAALGASQSLAMYAFSTILSIAGTNSSRTMLQRAMTRVLRAPMSFFDTTPLGRITNRFSKDIDTMDNTLTDAMRMYFITMAMIIAVFALIIVFFHYFGIALGPLLLLFVFAASYYRASAREMKRHEAVLRSTVFARFGEAITGVACIRAYGMQQHFTDSIRDAVDQMDSAYFLTFANQRWLSVRLDCIGNTLVFVTGILVVTSRFNVSPSIGGLVLSYILSIAQMIQFTIRQLAEVENSMNAAERLHYYGTELDEEAPLHLAPVRDAWPEQGVISFDNVQMRYRAGLPLVLKNLTLDVAGGERIGIVGRTGAGKSSIMSTLFRLTELSGGTITIDGVNIATIGLHDLRSRLAIIPQDPTLFRGTIRSNLDPFNEHSDLVLWRALRQSDLIGPDQDETSDVKTSRIHLDSTVDEEGLNFSLGQRQLMALARALVRGSQIIVCDEATSSVDFETDQKIQQTMASGFQGKTLLCIAHRLKTIINYDRICVMDQGQIAELGTPLDLFDRGASIFRGMCERSGIRREDILEGKM